VKRAFLPLFAVILLTVGASAQTTFTIAADPGCAHYVLYGPDLGDVQWLCPDSTVIKFRDGSQAGYSNVSVILTPDGNFTGTFNIQPQDVYHPIVHEINAAVYSGQWLAIDVSPCPTIPNAETCSETQPTSVTGTFPGGSVTYVFGPVLRGYRRIGNKYYPWYVYGEQGATGQLN